MYIYLCTYINNMNIYIYRQTEVALNESHPLGLPAESINEPGEVCINTYKYIYICIYAYIYIYMYVCIHIYI